MGKTALDEIQAAIFGILKNDATLMGLVTGVYDDAPQNTVYPYIVIGESTEVRFDMFSHAGNDTTFTLHVWSQYPGYKECYQISNQVNKTLDKAALAPTGNSLISCDYEGSSAVRDPDGVTRHLISNYRIMVQETIV